MQTRFGWLPDKLTDGVGGGGNTQKSSPPLQPAFVDNHTHTQRGRPGWKPHNKY